jgi:formylglycine-generating enzyme required for sulfatase activity/serine/threonine protein phosphatase PrpC
MFTFDISGAQIDGARDYQEDAFLITHLGEAEGGSLVIVADGMGGHAAGNVASNMAVQTFNKHITSNFPSENFPLLLNEAVLQANNSISETVRETAALKGMGCTLVAIVLEENRLRWVSVGDSHLYICRDEQIRKLNADHSYGGFLDRMAQEGNPVDPEAGFSRNMLMSALTGDEIADIDCPDSALELQPGDKLIIASDGLDTLSNGKILSFTDQEGGSKACVDALLAGVEEVKMPRQDNTTIVVVNVAARKESARVTAPAPDPEAPPTSERLTTQEQAARTGGFVIEDEEQNKGKVGLIAALVFIALAAAGGWWYFQQQQAPDDLLVEFDGPTEEIIVEDASEESSNGAEEEFSFDDESKEEPALENTAEPSAKVPAVAQGTTFSDSLKSGAKGPLMIALPAGVFTMGSQSSSADFDERPPREISMPSFAMSVNEVTIEQYRRFAKSNGRIVHKRNNLEPSKHPVVFVSWNDAVAYAQWLSVQTGKKYRIPSEAEWEYGARAGTTTSYWWGRYLGSDNAHCFACETGLDPRQPTRNGRFKANPYGLFDTSGNVQEWVYDCYNKDYAGAPSDGSVFAGGDCSVRVVRGGGYSSGPKALRSAARDKFRFDAGNDGIGIRVVRDLD